MPGLLTSSGGHAQRVRQLELLAPVTPGQVTLLSVAMKCAAALAVLSAAALILLIACGVVQEVHLKYLRTLAAAKAEAMDVNEKTLASAKSQVRQLGLEVETERTKTKELQKRREEIENSKKEAEGKLQNCNSEKAREGEGGAGTFTFPGYPVRLWIHCQHSLTNAVFLIRKVMGRKSLKPKQPSMISKVSQERMIWSTDVLV